MRRWSRRGRVGASIALTVIAAIALLLGGFTLYLRQEVFDDGAFADRAQSALQHGAIRQTISDELVETAIRKGSTELLQAKPLVQTITEAALRTPAFGAVFRTAALHVHRLAFSRDESSVALDLADVGQVVAGAARAIAPQIAIIRATTADERGNLTYEHEGAYLGGMDQALAAHNNGGIVIAQVKRITKDGSLRPHDVRVPGVLVDYIVVDPDQMQTTQTSYDPAISGEIFRPLDSFRVPAFDIQKVIARRVATELESGSAVNLGFGISANVPRILLEEGCHGDVTWVIEQGPVGGIPLLDFAFGCASNAEAFVPSPYQFTYFQGGGFDASLLSFLQIDKSGSVNVSRLGAKPHVTAGAGGFVDITCRARRIVFSGMFNAGAKLAVADGKLVIEREGKIKKLVNEVEHVTFSGRRGIEQGQDVTYVTERCVRQLTPAGLMVTEIAPGVDLARDILAQSEFELLVSDRLKPMDACLFRPEPIGLALPTKAQRNHVHA